MFENPANFYGKDPMRWWIGQVTDPIKGDWEDSTERSRAQTDDLGYHLRVRVRIVGYHDNADDLPDKDLPMAQVLLPSNTATTGGRGQTLQYQGGEVVVGFFLDGDDAQQPIIFGTLFKQPYIADNLTRDLFKKTKSIGFQPYTPPDVVQRSGKHCTSSEWEPNSPRTISFTPGLPTESSSHIQKELATNIKTAAYSPCEDNEISKITNTIKDLIRITQDAQSLNDGRTYVNPAFGGFIDIAGETKLASLKIHNSMTKLVRRGRSWLVQETFSKLSETFKDKVAKPLQAPTGQATKDLSDIIFCNIEKIQDELLDYLQKSLENMVGKVLDVPACGIENFLGDMFGQINNILDNNLGGLFSQLNNIQGGGIALPSETFSKAIRFANIITNVLECDKLNCPETSVFSAKNGVLKDREDFFGDIISAAGINSLVNPLLDKIDNAIDASPTRPDCNTNVLKCGPPRVDFIGSAGQGATGTAVVNALGNIIGVAINGTGFGYEEPPLLSFFDSCDKGYGAGGYPVMGEVTDPLGNKSLGVIDVVMVDSGQEYIPNTTETDAEGNVKELVPDPDASYDGESSFVTELGDVVVQNAGFGYSDGDTVEVGNNAEIQLKIENGYVIDASIVKGGFGFTDLPDLIINSDTGTGAKLLPVLKFKKLEDASEIASTTQDAVISVIDCIHK